LTSFFWLAHSRNLSVSPRRAPIRAALSSTSRGELVQALGPRAWGDTDERLAALTDQFGAGKNKWTRRNR
jgi:hypothetical protein